MERQDIDLSFALRVHRAKIPNTQRSRPRLTPEAIQISQRKQKRSSASTNELPPAPPSISRRDDTPSPALMSGPNLITGASQLRKLSDTPRQHSLMARYTSGVSPVLELSESLPLTHLAVDVKAQLPPTEYFSPFLPSLEELEAAHVAQHQAAAAATPSAAVHRSGKKPSRSGKVHVQPHQVAAATAITAATMTPSLSAKLHIEQTVSASHRFEATPGSTATVPRPTATTAQYLQPLRDSSSSSESTQNILTVSLTVNSGPQPDVSDRRAKPSASTTSCSYSEDEPIAITSEDPPGWRESAQGETFPAVTGSRLMHAIETFARSTLRPVAKLTSRGPLTAAPRPAIYSSLQRMVEAVLDSQLLPGNHEENEENLPKSLDSVLADRRRVLSSSTSESSFDFDP